MTREGFNAADEDGKPTLIECVIIDYVINVIKECQLKPDTI